MAVERWHVRHVGTPTPSRDTPIPHTRAPPRATTVTFTDMLADAMASCYNTILQLTLASYLLSIKKNGE